MARPNHDAKYLATLQDYYARHRLIPSYAAISALLGFSARTAAASLVKRLEAAGYLQRTPDRRLTPTARFFERPRAIASVRAGLPEAVLDAAADMVSLDSLLVHTPSRTFFVPIRGDSMRDAGLLEGDTAICEQGREARPGDIVVALVNDELTIKTLVVENSGKDVSAGQQKEDGNEGSEEDKEEDQEQLRETLRKGTSRKGEPGKGKREKGEPEKEEQGKAEQTQGTRAAKGTAGTRLVLRPENPAYPVLRPDSLEIIGVVTGSFRSYRR